ncbi:MAG: DUF11 domain-containing protein [Anaerolineae bacterium]
MNRISQITVLFAILLLAAMIAQPALATVSLGVTGPAESGNLPPPAPGARPPTAPPLAKVAVFDDPAYVDTANFLNESESDNVQASLSISLTHTVSTFTGTTATDFSNGLAGQDILLIPELENGDLAAALSVTATGVISNFVANGGGLIIHGAHSITESVNAPGFLNQVFGFSISSVGTLESGFVTIDATAAAGTAFATAPSAIANPDTVQYLLSNSLPAGSRVIYDTPFGAGVILMPFGSGQIVFLGWDWFNAAPTGTRDDGWVAVLDAAVHQLLPPDLRISKTVSASTVGAGQPLTYTITFSNAGGMAGGLIPTGIVITDVLPVSVTNVSVSSSGGITASGGISYTWQVADLAPSQGGMITITGRLISSTPVSITLTNAVTIGTATAEVSSGNNTAQAAFITASGQQFIYIPLVLKN